MFSCVLLGKEQAWGLVPNVPESVPYDEIESEERGVCGRWQTSAVQVCHVKPAGARLGVARKPGTPSNFGP